MEYSSKIMHYWNEITDIAGVVPFITGLKLEIPYRCYSELKTFLSLVSLNKNVSFLELGCGAGRWALAVAPSVKQYTGVDFSDVLLKAARCKTGNANLKNTIFEEMDLIHFLKNTTETFDVIYFSGVSLYFSDESLEQVIDLAVPRLNPGGRIIERTTTSLHRHEINNESYFGIYRTSQELIELFSCNKSLKYKNSERSYVFPRGIFLLRLIDRFYQRFRWTKVILSNQFTNFLIEVISRLLEYLKPRFRNGLFSGNAHYDHRFFIFDFEEKP